MLTTRNQRRMRSIARKASRRGLASIEVTATIAIMTPICAGLLFLGIKICAALYQTIGTLVSWPFL